LQFSEDDKEYFGADEGAFSQITSKDESTKHQITLADYESELVTRYFGATNICIGPVKDNPVLASKEFILWNSKQPIHLKLNYPKPGKSELRLYMSQREGFRPPANAIFFLYTKPSDSNLYIGWMNHPQWAVRVTFNEKRMKSAFDADDNAYQDEILALEAKMPKTSTVTTYPRSSVLGLARKKEVRFECENNSSHTTFKSITGNQFVESHHLVPMKAQTDFSTSLDIKDNIVILCPTCHKAIHYGTTAVVENLLNKFFPPCEALLARKGIALNINQLRKYYGLSYTVT